MQPMDAHNPTLPEVIEVDVSQIRTRFRLRTPDEDKIKELADSIKIAGLINPITIDQNNYLIAGFHGGALTKNLVMNTSQRS